MCVRISAEIWQRFHGSLLVAHAASLLAPCYQKKTMGIIICVAFLVYITSSECYAVHDTTPHFVLSPSIVAGEVSIAILLPAVFCFVLN